MSAKVFKFTAPHPQPPELLAAQCIVFPDGRTMIVEYGGAALQTIVERWWRSLGPEAQRKVEAYALIPLIGIIRMEREVFAALPVEDWMRPLLEGL
jgi:hypothetical protein